jgi:ribonucleotide reductase beta subunit family protein with ferritin-like domain
MKSSSNIDRQQCTTILTFLTRSDTLLARYVCRRVVRELRQPKLEAIVLSSTFMMRT